MVLDKTARLSTLVGESPGPSKSSRKKKTHFKHEDRETTPREFLKAGLKKFKCDLLQNGRVYTVSYELLRETDNCLYYWAELGISNKDFYVAPVYVFKQPCKFATELMKLVVYEEQEEWCIISGAHQSFNHLFRDRLAEGQRAPDPFVECFDIYFGFDPYAPISPKEGSS